MRSVHSFHFNLPLLIVDLKIHARRRTSNTFKKACRGWSESRLETFTSLVFNMVIESVSTLLLRDKCLQHSCQSAALLYTLLSLSVCVFL